MSLGLGGIVVLEGLYIVRSISVSVLEESDLAFGRLLRIICALARLLGIKLSKVRYRRMEQRSIERADNSTGEEFAQWVIYIQFRTLIFHLFRLYYVRWVCSVPTREFWGQDCTENFLTATLRNGRMLEGSDPHQVVEMSV